MATATSRGMRNNNPLNIELGDSWQGLRREQTDGRFCQFTSLEYGYRAAFIIIRNYLRKRPPVDTVKAIVERWAPSSENNTTAYLDYVCKRGYLQPYDRIKWDKKNDVCRLVWAMAQYETGEPQNFGRIENAYAMACRPNQ